MSDVKVLPALDPDSWPSSMSLESNLLLDPALEAARRTAADLTRIELDRWSGGRTDAAGEVVLEFTFLEAAEPGASHCAQSEHPSAALRTGECHYRANPS